MRPAARIPRDVRQSQPKQKDRVRRSHRQFVAGLPCLSCGRTATTEQPNECAHVRMGTDGGMGLKPSDRYTCPLCHTCHARQHQIGEPTFWAELGVDPTDAALRLWTVSGDHEQGLRLIFKVRQRIALYAHRGIPA